MPARGSANRQPIGQILEAAFGTPPIKGIQITEEIDSPRGTSQSAPPTIKTKGDPKGKSIIHIFAVSYSICCWVRLQ